MKPQPVVSPQEWEAAREQLLVKEKTHLRARDALAAERRRMPWMAVEKTYKFEGPKGKASLLFAYALGKAQRILAGLDASIGPIFTHGAVERLNGVYRESGVALPGTIHAASAGERDWSRALILAPPSANGTPWTRRFGQVSTGFVSGWMRIRGARRRRSLDRGFVLSDHADWPGLQRAIVATGAERVIVTHGYEAVMVRWLSEQGLEASAFETEYGDSDDEDPHPVPLPQAGEGEGTS